MELTRTDEGLSGRIRFVGDDQVIDLGRVVAEGAHLSFDLPLRRTYPVHLAFDGVAGTGTWGDPAAQGGVAVAVKRR